MTAPQPHPGPDGVTAASTSVFDQPPPTGARTDVPIGDVVRTSEQPLLELSGPQQILSVVVNVSYARLEEGTHAIRVVDSRGQVPKQLTAAQAHQLAVDALEAANIVSTIRQQAGFTS